MNHIGLFEGIGGFSLAARWMGWNTIAWCEWDKDCQRVLKHHFPKANGHGDIRTTDFSIYRGQCDILTGGFPCQPYSTAGKRLGKEDDRHLWPEMLRAIREIAPRYVVGENVRGLLSWNGGMVFDEVQTDLEACGYEVLPFILPACGVNAPHRRDRVWFVAYCNERTTGSSGKSGCIEGNWGKNNDEQKEWGASAKLNTGCREFLRPYENTHSNGWSSDIGKEESEVGRFGNIGTGNNERVHSEEVDADATSTRLQLTGCSRERRAGFENHFGAGISPNPQRIGQQRSRRPERQSDPGQNEEWKASWSHDDDRWPTQPPIRGKYDGLSEWMVRSINPIVYGSISEKNSREDLQEVWSAIQSPEIRKKIGRLYKIHEPDVLLQTVQLCTPGNSDKTGTSIWSEKASKDCLRALQKYKSFANTPQGRRLEKQFTEQFTDTLPKLSHEIALVTMAAERGAKKALKSWRENSIKQLGNAIVPQIAHQIFKAIELTEINFNQQ